MSTYTLVPGALGSTIEVPADAAGSGISRTGDTMRASSFVPAVKAIANAVKNLQDNPTPTELTWTAQNTSLNPLVAGTNYTCNTSTYAEFTLPGSPSANQMIRIWNTGPGNVYYYAGAVKVLGTTIVQGIVRRGMISEFRYIDSTTGWVVDRLRAPCIWSTSLVGFWNPETHYVLTSSKFSQLTDLSTSAWHFLQTTAGNRPVPATVDGHVVAQFTSATPTYMTVAHAAGMNMTAWTCSAMVQRTNNTSGSQVIMAHTDSSGQGQTWLYSNAQSFRTWIAPYGQATRNLLVGGRWFRFRTQYQETATNTITAWINGSLESAIPSTTLTSLVNYTGALALGANSSGTSGWDGYIGPVPLRNAYVAPAIAEMDDLFIRAFIE